MRREWARMVFWVKGTLLTFWTLGGLVLYYYMFVDINEEFDTGLSGEGIFGLFLNASMAFSTILAVVILAFTVWIVKFLSSDAVGDEFKAHKAQRERSLE